MLKNKTTSFILTIIATAFVFTPSAAATSSSITTTTAPTTVTCPTSTINVSTSSQLQAALSTAIPGDVITVTDGTYVGPFSIPAGHSGMQASPITLCGSQNAVLNGNGKSHVFTLSGTFLCTSPSTQGCPTANVMAMGQAVNWWNLEGFTITNGNKGLDLANANDNTIIGVTIHNTSGAGIHVESFSAHNDFEGDLVYNTGAEGIYNGSAVSNWSYYSGGAPDKSDYNRYNGLIVYNTTADPFDLKEGSSNGVVSNNRIDGAMNTKAKGWVDSKGNNWMVLDNAGTNSQVDGFGNHVVAAGWGQNNIFRGNAGQVNASGWAFHVDAASTGTIVDCGQTVTNAAAGYSSEPCTPVVQ